MLTEIERTFPKITEEGLDALRQRIGIKIGVTVEPWCYEATRDNIRHYAHGIGDDNPLWCVPEYAAKTRYGDVIALPSFLFATSRIVSGYVGGLAGVHAMWSGADWNWHKTVKRNDTISTEAWLKDVVEHQTRFAGRAVQQTYHVDFYNQHGDLVAGADSWCFRTERDHAREKGTKYKDVKARQPRRYTDQELADAYKLYRDEEIRGAIPRYWQDVAEGEALPVMLKGPMTVTGFIAYAQGWGGLYIRANKLAWKLIDAHPGIGIKNRFGIPDCPERVHWEEEFAHEVGAPGAYDYGPERSSWLTHHLTNWMGDDGFLRNATCKIRRHNPAGDILFIKGKVARKYVEAGVTWSRSSRKRATRTTSCRCWARGSWNCRVGAEARGSLMPAPDLSRGALTGLRVIDLSRVLAGPLCTQMLADHGADVVKIEPPAGDETRLLGPPFDDAGDAAYFGAVNRGKRALGLDLARPEGRAVLEALLKDADIVVENYLPGTMERWNLGYDEVLAARHPRLIYCAISGFGADGPLGGLPGYDAVLQAMSGLMSINGTPESGPTRVGVPIVDYVTGYNALTGILLALAARQQTGKGQRIDATLFDTALGLLVPHAANWLSSGRTPGRLGSAHPNIAPYDKFAAGDGELFLGIVNDGQFRRFCRQVKREDLLEDPRFGTNAARLAECRRAALRDRANAGLLQGR